MHRYKIIDTCVAGKSRCVAGIGHIARIINGLEWSGRRDSNPRPSAPKADALPDCATPRLLKLYRKLRRHQIRSPTECSLAEYEFRTHRGGDVDARLASQR